MNSMPNDKKTSHIYFQYGGPSSNPNLDILQLQLLSQSVALVVKTVRGTSSKDILQLQLLSPFPLILCDTHTILYPCYIILCSTHTLLCTCMSFLLLLLSQCVALVVKTVRGTSSKDILCSVHVCPSSSSSSAFCAYRPTFIRCLSINPPPL